MRRLKEGHFLGTAHPAFHQEGIIVSQAAYDKRVYQGWHCHEHHHVSLLLKGGNREQRSRGEQEVQAGRVLFYHSGERHKNSHTQHPSRNINIEITDAFFRSMDYNFMRWINSRSIATM